MLPDRPLSSNSHGVMENPSGTTSSLFPVPTALASEHAVGQLLDTSFTLLLRITPCADQCAAVSLRSFFLCAFFRRRSLAVQSIPVMSQSSRSPSAPISQRRLTSTRSIAVVMQCFVCCFSVVTTGCCLCIVISNLLLQSVKLPFETRHSFFSCFTRFWFEPSGLLEPNSVFRKSG